MRRALLLMTVCVVLAAVGCSWTNTAKDFGGLQDADGNAVTHVSTSKLAVHLLFKEPVLGDATLEATGAAFADGVKDAGGARFRIVQSGTTTYWWVLPPVSFVIHPVLTNIAGDAIK